MKNLVLIFASFLAVGSAGAQINVKPLPQPALAAKTVAIVNNTHNEAVSEGAEEALKRWGRFTIVDDSDSADITLTFDKKSEHEGMSTQKTGDDGKPNTNYSPIVLIFDTHEGHVEGWRSCVLQDKHRRFQEESREFMHSRPTADLLVCAALI